MSELVVRAYNVGFGDAVLVSIPERDVRGRETIRHLLIDVGNLLTGKANTQAVLRDVITDIAARTGGEVDLYVMSHEHLDHVRGLLTAKRGNIELRAKYAWLTGSADPGYYDVHPTPKRRRLEMQHALLDTHRVLAATRDQELELMLENNSTMLPGFLNLSTADHVDHLRTLAPSNRTHYVDRTTTIARKHPSGKLPCGFSVLNRIRAPTTAGCRQPA